jgi:hypothetical protein
MRVTAWSGQSETKMLDQELLRIARKRIKCELLEDRHRLDSEIAAVKDEMTDRGMLRSSVTVKRVIRVYEDAIVRRVEIVWTTLFRFVTTPGISYSETLSDDLKAVVESFFPSQVYENSVRQDIRNSFPGADHGLRERILQDVVKFALDKTFTEIDLFVFALKSQEKMKKEGTIPTVVNFYSPVGSVQTGHHSVANVSQTINPDVSATLREVLDAVEEHIERLETLPGYSKTEIIEIVRESRMEAEKEKPNRAKLQGLLSTVGTAISTVGSMSETYQKLKQTFPWLGLP